MGVGLWHPPLVVATPTSLPLGPLGSEKLSLPGLSHRIEGWDPFDPGVFPVLNRFRCLHQSQSSDPLTIVLFFVIISSNKIRWLGSSTIDVPTSCLTPSSVGYSGLSYPVVVSIVWRREKSDRLQPPPGLRTHYPSHLSWMVSEFTNIFFGFLYSLRSCSLDEVSRHGPVGPCRTLTRFVDSKPQTTRTQVRDKTAKDWYILNSIQ